METMEALYLLKNTIIYSQTLCRLLPSTVREQKLQVNVLTFPALPPKLIRNMLIPGMSTRLITSSFSCPTCCIYNLNAKMGSEDQKLITGNCIKCSFSQLNSWRCLRKWEEYFPIKQDYFQNCLTLAYLARVSPKIKHKWYWCPIVFGTYFKLLSVVGEALLLSLILR